MFKLIKRIFKRKPKLIELDKYDKQWIKFAKGHYKDKFPLKESWVNSAIPLYSEIYQYDLELYPHWKYNLFSVLFDVYMKIQDDGSGTNKQLKELFNLSLQKDIIYTQEEPIDRMISKLFALIQGTRVLDVEGNKRFELDIKK